MPEPRPSAVRAAAARVYVWFLLRRNLFRLLWQGCSIGIFGLNSFLILFHRSAHDSMRQVVLFALIAYITVFLAQTIRLRSRHARRHRVAWRTRTVFRLIYTALYLTAVMLDVLSATAQPGGADPWLLAYYGWLFFGMLLWGTSCLWGGRALRGLKAALRKRLAPPPDGEEQDRSPDQ